MTEIQDVIGSGNKTKQNPNHFKDHVHPGGLKKTKTNKQKKAWVANGICINAGRSKEGRDKGTLF